MGAHVTLACLVVLSCLLPSTVSDYKKRIIVKVPHLIKHIHHSHFKPIHVHKVHEKKVDHHYHDDHEDTSNKWKHGKEKVKKGKKLWGSFSDLKPVLLHQEIEEHMEYPDYDGKVNEADQNHRVGHRLEFEQPPRPQFDPEDVIWGSNDTPPKNRPKNRDESGSREHGFNRHSRFNRNNYVSQENNKLKPIDLTTWLNEDDGSSLSSSEDLVTITDYFPQKNKKSDLQKQKRIAINKPFLNTGPKHKKSKLFNWRLEDEGMENDGWRPMINTKTRELFYNTEPNHQQNLGEYFIDSGEQTPTFGEGFYNLMEDDIKKRTKKRKQKKKKAQKVVHQYEDFNHEDGQESSKRKPSQQNDQDSSSQDLVPPQIQPQVYQPLQPQQGQLNALLSTQPQINWTPQQVAASRWQNQVIQHPTQTFPQPQTQMQLIPQQHTQAILQPQSQFFPQLQTQLISQHQTQSVLQHKHEPQPQATLTPKVVWSGHHLQMPQHSMWHIQQHSEAPSLQTLTVNHNPLQALQFHQPHSLLHPVQPQSQQLTMGSSQVHHVVPPDWPLTRKSPDSSVKQHWEQHVQTTGSDGPSSSYRVEVVNYNDKKNAR